MIGSGPYADTDREAFLSPSYHTSKARVPSGRLMNCPLLWRACGVTDMSRNDVERERFKMSGIGLLPTSVFLVGDAHLGARLSLRRSLRELSTNLRASAFRLIFLRSLRLKRTDDRLEATLTSATPPASPNTFTTHFLMPIAR